MYAQGNTVSLVKVILKSQPAVERAEFGMHLNLPKQE
jgi:hypothetical protein